MAQTACSIIDLFDCHFEPECHVKTSEVIGSGRSLSRRRTFIHMQIFLALVCAPRTRQATLRQRDQIFNP